MNEDTFEMNVPAAWAGEDVTTLAYTIAGAVSAVFMKRMPDLVMPEKEITEAVKSVLASDPRPPLESSERLEANDE